MLPPVGIIKMTLDEKVEIMRGSLERQAQLGIDLTDLVGVLMKRIESLEKQLSLYSDGGINE